MAKKRRNRIFIGDVHGCRKELDDLLEAVDFRPKRHELWFTGDLVNRGPDSAGVVRRVRKLGGHTVLGNHDLHFLGCLNGSRSPRSRDRLKKLLRARDCNELAEWMASQYVLATWEDVLLVHAGMHPDWNKPEAVAKRMRKSLSVHGDMLRKRRITFAARVRYCDRKGRRPRAGDFRRGRPKARFRPWDDWYEGDRTVVFGHWAQRGLVVDQHLRGLDTACVYGGRLTAWVAEEDRLVSVPARKQYVVPGA